MDKCPNCDSKRIERVESGVKQCSECGEVFETESGEKLEVKYG